MEYRVEWVIELEADSPREAAEKALAIHRNPESIATVFSVWDEYGENHGQIDLLADDDDDDSEVQS